MKNQSGFTITELLVSVAISSVMAFSILYLTVYFMGDLYRARASAELAIESQTLLRTIVEDVRLADSLKSTNANADPQATVWATNDPSNVMIIALPALDSSRDIIYDSTTTLPYVNEVVYHTNGSSMYRRVLIDPSATGNISVTQCPEAIVTSTCPPEKLFTENLDDLTFTFYDSTDTTTSDATQARSVQITVSLSKKIYGKEVAFSNTIRTTLRNR